MLLSNWSTDTHVAGRYRLERLIRQGGMGQVHAAHDTLLQRQVAIKTLGEDATRDPVARAWLRREALAAAALDHPFICNSRRRRQGQGTPPAPGRAAGILYAWHDAAPRVRGALARRR